MFNSNLMQSEATESMALKGVSLEESPHRIGREAVPQAKNVKLESENSEESKRTKSDFEELDLLACGNENVLISSLKSPFKGLQIDPAVYANKQQFQTEKLNLKASPKYQGVPSAAKNSYMNSAIKNETNILLDMRMINDDEGLDQEDFITKNYALQHVSFENDSFA